MKAIVIATTKGRDEWVENCLNSFNGYDKYPIIVLDEYDYELGKIKYIFENRKDIDEFILLHDSVELKNTDWIEEVFNIKGGVSFHPRPYFMYLGKYRREILKQVYIPTVNSKREAVRYEVEWNELYRDTEGQHTVFADLRDTDVFEEKFGRLNMVIEDNNLIKYKHIWHEDMIRD